MRPANPQGAAAPPRGGNIGLGPKGTGQPGRARNPFHFWDEYYKTHDESPGELLDKITAFRKEKQFADVEAALRGYLTHRLKRAEPWMYEMLAVAIEERKGSPEEVKTLLGYAAFKALQSKNPNLLLSLADMLYRRRIFDKVGPAGLQTSAGELIDMVAKQVPHRGEPLLMSINLAAKTKDPKRMGDAVEALLSLGWPGNDAAMHSTDETIRSGAREQVEKLAKTLREDGRGDESDALLARLPGALARDVFVRLKWQGVDDLDLIVDEPLGASAQLFKSPRTVFGGAIVSNGYGKHPEEVYVCPRAFDGTYTVRVDKIYQPENSPAKVAELEIITHQGTPQEKTEKHTIQLDKPAPVTFKLEGGRRKEVLPFMAAPPKPPVLVPDDPSKPAPLVVPKPNAGVAAPVPGNKR